MANGNRSTTPNSRLVPVVPYVEPLALAKQLAYRDTTDERLTTVCMAATEAIDDWVGNTEQWPADGIPFTIQTVALSLAVDIWKQPDATFGIMGMSETGPVRVPRDLVVRYDASLIPFYNGTDGWGIA